MSPQGNYFDVTQTKPVDVPLSAVPTASGANVVLDLKAGLTFPVAAVVSGSSLYIPPTPIPAGPISFVDGFSGYWSTFVDSDADGIGDTANGTYTYAGPGFRLDGLKWELVRSQGTVNPVPPIPPVAGAAPENAAVGGGSALSPTLEEFAFDGLEPAGEK
jgi:hypothetical protein